MVKMNNNYLARVIKVRLFKQSTNTVSPTDAKKANKRNNQAQLRSKETLVGVRFHFVFDNYSDEYEMMAMVNRYLVN
jgi:hypothetical protein